MVADYGPIAIFLVIAIGFAVVPLVLARLLRPSNPNAIKQSSYECGIETTGTSWIRYYAGFYIYALIFVIFDVETVFLYPWAVAYGNLGLFALIEMFIFIGILALGLVYAWRKKALEWQ